MGHRSVGLKRPKGSIPWWTAPPKKKKRMKPEIEDQLRDLAKDIPQEEWDEFEKAINRSQGAKWHIGDRVKDKHRNIGVVAIVWDYGDIWTTENDAADLVLIEE